MKVLLSDNEELSYFWNKKNELKSFYFRLWLMYLIF